MSSLIFKHLAFSAHLLYYVCPLSICINKIFIFYLVMLKMGNYFFTVVDEIKEEIEDKNKDFYFTKKRFTIIPTKFYKYRVYMNGDIEMDF